MFPENVWSEDNVYVPYLASMAKIVFVPNVLYMYGRTGLSSVSYNSRTIAVVPVVVEYLLSICKCSIKFYFILHLRHLTMQY